MGVLAWGEEVLLSLSPLAPGPLSLPLSLSLSLSSGERVQLSIHQPLPKDQEAYNGISLSLSLSRVMREYNSQLINHCQRTKRPIMESIIEKGRSRPTSKGRSVQRLLLSLQSLHNPTSFGAVPLSIMLHSTIKKSQWKAKPNEAHA